MLRRKALLAMFAAILAVPGVAGAITPDQVLIVVNDRAPISERIGEYYRMARGIPKEHVARIQTDPHEEIDRATFKREVERPVGEYLMGDPTTRPRSGERLGFTGSPGRLRRGSSAQAPGPSPGRLKNGPSVRGRTREPSTPARPSP